MPGMGLGALKSDLAACEICRDRFGATATGHRPRPVVWFNRSARILVAGQAPGLRVHQAGKPFFDRSGDRLREWMGIDADTFYDRSRLAVVPMAFCFPGYDDAGSDLPPPRINCSVSLQRTRNHNGVHLLTKKSLHFTLLVAQLVRRYLVHHSALQFDVSGFVVQLLESLHMHFVEGDHVFGL